MALHLCAECNRHVRTTEAACPFCGALGAVATASPVSRATRAALVFGATVLVAGAAAACSDSASSDTGPVALYGGPPIDASVDAGADSRADADASPAALYGGGPPIDAAPTDAAPTDAAEDAPKEAGRDGSPAPAYGLPP
ncbi:MAG: hypothetical protein IPF92_18340 [Myxococcales bacterium]|nr:hypothetical protein [Myxococcales bacterium]MBL0197157.1 hypothetical protein [Myxococcales bacterium]